MQKFVVHTQYLENYGAHSGEGTFESGEAHWKMKGGETYIVEDLDRIQDAVAYVATSKICNGNAMKEFPTRWETYSEWYIREILNESCHDYRDFKLEEAQVISPKRPGESASFASYYINYD